MSPIRVWLHAIRPRTLFLAAATVILGTALGYFYGAFRLSVCILTLSTALLLQIISNLANDLGDFLKGTDAARIGQTRTVQAGWISVKHMRIGLLIAVSLACFSGCALLWRALGPHLFAASMIYLLLGGGAVAAALAYTLGKKPFGYQGFGDSAVFFFFGIVGVCGTCYLQTHSFALNSLLPALAMGALSTGVLNINNMRDIDTDKNAGKKTVAVRLGKLGSRVYHALLVLAAFCATWAFVLINGISVNRALLTLALIMALFIGLTARIAGTTDPARLDPFLKVHSLYTFIYALCFGALLCLR